MRTITEELHSIAARYKNKTALMTGKTSVSYGELEERLKDASEFLKKSGVERGDRVAMLLPNCISMVIMTLASIETGACPAPINLKSGPRAVQACLKHCDPAIIVSIPEAAQLCEGLPYPLVISSPSDTTFKGDIKAFKSDVAMPDLKSPPAVMFFTSGTTGDPKGVLLTNENILSNVYGARDHISFDETQRMLTVLPLFHSFGFTVALMLPLLCGASVYIMPSFLPVQETLDVIAREKLTAICGVPTMYSLLSAAAEKTGFKFDGMRLCISGGDKLPIRIAKMFQEVTGGLPILEGYGLTETSPIIAVNPSVSANRLGSVGTILPLQIVKILGEDGSEMPVGTPGDVVIKGPNVMACYFRSPEETEKVIKNGWLHTGDVGHLDENGYLYIDDRKRDIIIVGGFNVYPQEVEMALLDHPAVREAAVFGLNKGLRGQMVKAIICLKEGAVAEKRDLIEHCKHNLAHYKVPRTIEFTQELPRSATGKILKRLLRNQKTETA